MITASFANAANRTALIFGNSRYEIAPLKNPVNDATDMAAALRASGFSVTIKLDATLREMEDAIYDFGKKLRRGGVGLFYFAGHGVRVKGSNYLIPIGARIESEGDVKYSSVDAGLILAKMEDAQNELNIVILDACRNNPFARSFRSAQNGLARMDAPTGSLIAYATAPGQMAADGEGRNGVYTKYLLRYIKEPGHTIEQVFKSVRIAVLKETGRKQTPWESSSLTGNFYFNTLKTQKPSAQVPQTKPTSKQASIQPPVNPIAKEKVRPSDYTQISYDKKYRELRMGTGGVTGVYYPTGGAIGRLVNKGIRKHNLYFGVHSTGGSVYNLNAIAHGYLDMGMAQSDWHYHAYHGTSKFSNKGPNKDLRSVFSVHPEPFTVVARADSGIRHLRDLKGKRVNIGNPGSGQRGTMEVVMRAMGWNKNSFRLASELRYSEQARALCDNKVDAIVYTVGHPSGSIKDVTTKCSTVIVPVTGYEIDRLVRENPYYRKAIIPGNMYRGNYNDVQTFGVGATVVTSARVPEDQVYIMAKSVFENFDQFKRLHPAFMNLKRKEMVKDSLTAPLHSGAARYYKETGLLY